MGIMLTKDQLTEVAEVSGVTDADGDAFDFMDQELNLSVNNYFQVLKKSSHVMQSQLSDFSRETLLVDLL